MSLPHDDGKGRQTLTLPGAPVVDLMLVPGIPPSLLLGGRLVGTMIVWGRGGIIILIRFFFSFFFLVVRPRHHHCNVVSLKHYHHIHVVVVD